MIEALISSELQELGEKVEYRPTHDYVVSHDYKANAREWIKTFGAVSPKEVIRLLERECDEVQIRFGPPANDVVEITFRDGEKSAEAELGVSADEPLARASSLDLHGLDADPNGSGMAKKALGNLCAFVRHFYPKIEDIVITAALTGAYAWARFGFIPHEESWNGQGNDQDPQMLHASLRERAAAIKDQLTAEQRSALDKLITSDSPESIWSIADMGKQITVPRAYRALLDRSMSEDNRMPIGKYLLAETQWHGRLDFNNERAMNRFNGYLAKLGTERGAPSVPGSSPGRGG